MTAQPSCTVAPAPSSAPPKRWSFPKSAAVHGVFGHSTWCGRYREKGEPKPDNQPITCGRCLATGG